MHTYIKINKSKGIVPIYPLYDINLLHANIKY